MTAPDVDPDARPDSPPEAPMPQPQDVPHGDGPGRIPPPGSGPDRVPPPRSGPDRAASRRLTRSRDDRVVAGVAGGIAEYFDIDPVLVRIAAVLLTLTAGTGVLAYLVGWAVLPEAPPRDSRPDRSARGARPLRRLRSDADLTQLGGFALLGLGGLLVLDRIGLGFRSDIAWPLALIGIGAAVLWSRRNSSDEPDDGLEPPLAGSGWLGRRDGEPGAGRAAHPGGPGDAADTAFTPPAAGEDDVAAAREAAWRELPPDPWIDLPADRPSYASGPPAGFSSGPPAGFSSGPPAGFASGPPAGAVRRTERALHRSRRDRQRRRQRGPLGSIAFGFFLVAGGVLWSLARWGPLDVTVEQGLAWLLLVVGGVLVAGAWFGRPRGFVLLGLLLTGLLSATAAFDVQWGNGFGTRFEAPATAAAVRSSYRLTAGEARLDLSKVDLRGKRADVTLDVGFGTLAVAVPPDVTVVVDAEVGAGEAVLFGATSDGWQIDRRARRAGASAASGTLYLTAHVGAGVLEIADASRFEQLDFRSGDRTIRPFDGDGRTREELR